MFRLMALVVLYLAAPTLNAQKQPEPTRPTRLVSGTVSYPLFDDVSSGTTWVRGRDFKARFDADGIEFSPFLGSTASRNHPLAIKLLGMKLGEDSIDLARPVGPIRRDRTIDLDHGALIERYRIAEDSVEQTFVVPRAPGASGDLVLTLGLETELVAKNPEVGAGDGAAIEFLTDEGGVRYGAAVAILADGRRVPVRTRLDRDRIELVLAGGEIEDDSFPLVIDPLITTISFTGATSADERDQDVAFVRDTQGSRDLFLVTTVRAFSATDDDVVATMLDSGGASISSFYVDVTSDSWSAARVAAHQPSSLLQIANGEFLVVATRTPAGGGIAGVWGRGVGAVGTFSVGLPFVIAQNSFWSNVAPDVGGDPDFQPAIGMPSPGYYLVVWQINGLLLDSSVGGALVAPGGSSISPFGIANSPQFERVPRVSKSSGRAAADNTPSGKAWTVVWETDHPLGGYQIEAVQYDPSGVQVTNPYFTVSYNFVDDRGPDVSTLTDADAAGRRCLVTWNRVLAPGGALGDVHGAIIENGVVVATANLTSLDHPGGDGLVQGHAAVASDGCRFVVAYDEEYAAGSSDLDVYASTFRYDGVQIVCDAAHENLAYSATAESKPALANYFPGLSPNYFQHNYAVVWQDETSPGQRGLEGVMLSGRQPGVMFDWVTTGCGPATLFTAGDPILNSYFEFGLTNVPQDALQILAISVPLAVPVPIIPGCFLGVQDPPIYQFDNLGGSLFLPELVSFTVPCDHSWVGATVGIQGFAIGNIPGAPVVNVVGGFTINLSVTDTLLVTFR